MWRPRFPYGSISIDCSGSEWLHAMRLGIHCPKSRKELLSEIAVCFSSSDILVTLSVRSSLDLYLQSHRFPHGSEVLMTAINIPEMSRILRYHGLIPVPLDLDITTLATTTDRLVAAISPQTRLLLVAFVYGTRYDLGQIAAITSKHGIRIFEDCAEGFCGLGYTGSPFAEVSTFSFGPIKTSTAFAGAISVIRSGETLARMASLQSEYSIQSDSAYLKRVMQYACGNLIVRAWLNIGLIRKVAAKAGFDHRAVVIRWMSSFPSSKDVLAKYRVQPATALLAFLLRRIQRFSEMEFREGGERLEKAQRTLEDGGITVPGSRAEVRNFWLFAVLSDRPQAALEVLNKNSIDAYCGTSQLGPVEAPVGSRYSQPTNVHRMFEQLVYLPFNASVRPLDLQAMTACAVSLISPQSKL